MKKIAIFVLTLALALAVCACSNTQQHESKPTQSTSETEGNATSNTASGETSEKNELVYDSTEAFDYAEVDGGITIIEFKNYDYTEYDKIIVPSEIDGKKVVGIGDNEREYNVFGAIFGECEVVIPDTVTYIGGEAFFYSKGLVKVSGGENCKSIGENAFAYCENLTEVTFLDHVTDIADNAFGNCPKLK